jgi:Kef-type K+ transport system membrane component KefB
MGSGLMVLAAVALVAGVSRLLARVLARAGQPPVMAEVLAGILLGASVLGALPGDPSARLFAPDVLAVLRPLGDAAVVAYLFVVGARLDPRALRVHGAAATGVATASFLVPGAAGALLALGLHAGVEGDPPRSAFVLFVAVALGVTAFPVLARIIEARGLEQRPAGRIALAAAAGQELLVWPALAVALALAGTADAAPLEVLARGAAALLLVAVLARAAARRGGAPVVLAALAVSAAATEAAGLHVVVGAFAFGALLPAQPRAAALAVLAARPVAAASALLLPLFFALPALRVDLSLVGGDALGVFAIVLAVAVAAKVTSAAAAAALAGVAPREALAVGTLMNARGLVELVVLTAGLEAGLVDVRLFTIMVLMALTTTFATGPLLALVDRERPPARRPATT